ncbi:MAG: hypothetical protein GX613_00940 [Chloroflexi bacterium]|nr:hypothetical protein [Chloroflexota bacterium]
MKYSGTITRVLVTKQGATIILDTEIGPRGIELERPDWLRLLKRAGQTDPDALVGWEVDYDPAHDNLDLLDPDRAEDDLDDAEPDDTDGETANGAG